MKEEKDTVFWKLFNGIEWNLGKEERLAALMCRFHEIDWEQEGEDRDGTFLRLLDEMARKEREDKAAAPLLFRGQPISWATTQQTRQVAEKNAFGPDTISERPGRKRHLIEYGGQPYAREDFYRAMF